MRQQTLLLLARELALPSGQAGGVTSVAVRAGISRFKLHRSFAQLFGESPKAWSQRVRLEQAAGKLVAGSERILDIALDAGFESHEAFARAFQRRFGMSAREYRRRGLRVDGRAPIARHAEVLREAAPCLRLFHVSLGRASRRTPMPTIEIRLEERGTQPVLLIRRRIPRAGLQPMLAECFGTLFGHSVRSGLALAGPPTARYVSMGPGLWTVEAMVPLASAAAGDGEIEAGALPGGNVARAVHVGPYEELSSSHAALERWIEEQGLRVAGAPWEVYVTDPGEVPDPERWRTEICWPVQAS